MECSSKTTVIGSISVWQLPGPETEVCLECFQLVATDWVHLRQK